MADNETPEKPDEKPAEQQPQTPPASPPPNPNPPQSNAGNGDIAALATLVAAIPERVAHAVRESMPAPPPAPKTNKHEDSSTDSDKSKSKNSEASDSRPGKHEVKATLFGIPWH